MNYQKILQRKSLSILINYYEVISEFFDPKYILTTNYTPIVRSFFTDADITYLSGELTMFEDISTMSVKHYSEYSNKNILFPFLLTQAPIKPIICPYQIRQYTNLNKTLNDVSLLLVLGYSCCEYDSHINSFIREFPMATAVSRAKSLAVDIE